MGAALVTVRVCHNLLTVLLRDILGMVTMSNMTSRMLIGGSKGPPVLRTDPVTKVLYKQFEMVS